MGVVGLLVLAHVPTPAADSSSSRHWGQRGDIPFSPLFHSWFCLDHPMQVGVCSVHLLMCRKFGWSSSPRGEIKGIHDSMCGGSFSLLSPIASLWICSSSRSHKGSIFLFPLSYCVSHSHSGPVCMCVTLTDLWFAYLFSPCPGLRFGLLSHFRAM